MADLVLSGLFYALPNLELFNIRSQMVHNLPLPAGYLLTALLYWILYLGTLMMFSAFLFQKKGLRMKKLPLIIFLIYGLAISE